MKRIPLRETALALIAVMSLVGVAVPVHTRYRDNAHRLHCLENLQKIGEGIREWSRQNDFALPPGRGMSGFCNSPDGTPLPGNLYAVEPGLNALWDKGHGVIRDPGVFVCPGDPNIEPPPAVGEDFTSPGQLSYGMTGNLYPTDPGNKIIVADKSDKTLPDGRRRASANHSHRFINVLYADGRVATIEKPFPPPGQASDPGSIYVRETGDRNETYIE